MAAAAADDDDYMSMTIADPTPKPSTTSLHRTQQKRKRAAEAARPLSKADAAAAADAARAAALATQLDASTNRGAKMLAKLGYKAGGPLGRVEGARTTPVELAFKDDRGGVGMESEKRRRVREEWEAAQGREKRVRAEEGEYRDRVAREREVRRLEGQGWGAMKVAEKLDAEAEEDEEAGGDESAAAAAAAVGAGVRRDGRPLDLRRVNVLWRGLVRDRAERERERRLRHELQDGLGRLPGIADREEDTDDRLALGTEVEELEEEDPELDAFNALDPAEKLQKLVDHLRTAHNYCFWCKYRYPDSSMDGCPGIMEDDHD